MFNIIYVLYISWLLHWTYIVIDLMDSIYAIGLISQNIKHHLDLEIIINVNN